LFDDLLIAPLHRAIALAEGNDGARAIAEDLHFDVSRALDVLLDEKPSFAEAALRKPLDGGEARAQLLHAPAKLHADAAAACRALQHDGKTDRVGGRHRILERVQEPAARQQMDVLRARPLQRRLLQTETYTLLR